jgi:branched-chain amino acid transport system substrate-binding protein
MNEPQRTEMARIAALVTLILLSFMLLAAAYPYHSATGHNVTRSPIYIGQIVPLTGNRAGIGSIQQDGAKLALREINSQGGIHGHPLQIFLADDQSTASGAIKAFLRLVGNHKIVAIIGPDRSNENIALTPYFKQGGIPVMIGGTASIVTHAGDPRMLCAGATLLVAPCG